MKKGVSKYSREVSDWEYRDDGCDLSPTCLACPFPICRYDHPGGLAGFLRMIRDNEIQALRETQLLPPEIATKFNISLRTIYRILQNGPSNKANPAGIRASERR